MCDVKIEDELENIINWLCVNKLQLNLLKTKELVFRRANVHLDIEPAQLYNVERLEYLKLLGVFIDSKLSFCEHVERLLCLYVIKDCIC